MPAIQFPPRSEPSNTCGGMGHTHNRRQQARLWVGVCLLALFVLSAVGALLCQDRGISVWMQRQWDLAYDSRADIPMQDPSPDATCKSWVESGIHLRIGPMRAEWPYSLMSGQRRGAVARALDRQANQYLFQELRFHDAAETYGRLAEIDPGPEWFSAKDRQARAYAAAGQFDAALQYIHQMVHPKFQFPGTPEYREDQAKRVRWKIWSFLQTDPSAPEISLRNSLSTSIGPFSEWHAAEKDPLAASAVRSEIRLILAELLLREGRRREARELLHQVTETRSYCNEDCKRLASAYLRQLKPILKNGMKMETLGRAMVSKQFGKAQPGNRQKSAYILQLIECS